MSDEKKDFVVKDKRMFSGEAPKEETLEDTEPASDEGNDKPETHGSEAAGEDYPLPEINFPTFIFSLNSSTLVHLGIIEDPATSKKVKNLSIAKQTIDILGMLEEKTQGNLSDDEANMLQTMLYELRMLYVKESE